MRHEPITDASAWRGKDLRDNDVWIYRLQPDDLEELAAAVAAVAAADRSNDDVGNGHFPLPRLASRIADWRHEIQSGRGFVLVKGVPVEQYTLVENKILLRGLCSYLGTSISQNSYGDLVGDVRDEGVEGIGVRGYRTNHRLMFHTDRCDMIGLMCLQEAREGGLSSIVSSMAVYNEILAHHPEYLQPLFDGMPFVNSEEGERREQWRVPVYSVHKGVLSCRCQRNTIERARKAGAHFTDIDNAALAYFDELAAHPDLRLDMELEKGDIQFINNYTTMHSRTAYVDHDEPARKRHMLRIWVNAEQRRPAGPAFNEYNGIAKTLNRA